MRIALVSDTYTPQVNGVTTVVVRIATVVREFGHHVAVVAPRYPGHVPTDSAELRIPSAAFPPYPAIRLSLPQFGAVARFLDAFKPDVVHVATEGPLGLTGRRYAVRRGISHFLSHEFPAIRATLRRGARRAAGLEMAALVPSARGADPNTR